MEHSNFGIRNRFSRLVRRHDRSEHSRVTQQSHNSAEGHGAIVAVDGHLADMEKHLCATASGKMDLTSEQFTEILDEVLGLDKK